MTKICATKNPTWTSMHMIRYNLKVLASVISLGQCGGTNSKVQAPGAAGGAAPAAVAVASPPA